MTSDAGTPSRLGETPPIAEVRAGRTVPIALLLFPAASVLGYMSRNLAETAVVDVLPALAGATACAVVVWLIVVALRGRADAGAAVIAALWVVAGLYYVALFGAINSWIGGDYTRTATLPIALVGLAAATFAVHRLRTLDAPIHIVLSAIAVVMLATPLAKIAAFEWRNSAARSVYDPDAAVAELAQFPGTAAQRSRRPRHLPLRVRPIRLGGDHGGDLWCRSDDRRLPGGAWFLRSGGQPRQLSQDRPVARLDLLSRLHRSPVRSAHRGDQLAPGLRHA